MGYSEGFFLVKDGPKGLGEFVSGFINPGEFYYTLRAKRIRFLPSMVLQVLRRPWLFRRHLTSYRHTSHESQVNEPGPCELSSIVVLPIQGIKGTEKALVHAFFAAIQNRAKRWFSL
jgi:hypothetical protein